MLPVFYLLPQAFAQSEDFCRDKQAIIDSEGEEDERGDYEPWEPLAFFEAMIKVASLVKNSTYFSCASGVSEIA